MRGLILDLLAPAGAHIYPFRHRGPFAEIGRLILETSLFVLSIRGFDISLFFRGLTVFIRLLFGIPS